MVHCGRSRRLPPDDTTTETDFIRATTVALSADATFVEPSQVRELCGDFVDVQQHSESLFDNGPMVQIGVRDSQESGCRSIVSGIFGDEVVEISPSLAMRVFLADGHPTRVVRLAASHGNLATRSERLGLARSALSVALGRSQVFQRLVSRRHHGNQRRRGCNGGSAMASYVSDPTSSSV